MNDQTLALVRDVLAQAGDVGSASYQAALHSVIVGATVQSWVAGVIAALFLIVALAWLVCGFMDRSRDRAGWFAMSAFAAVFCGIAASVMAEALVTLNAPEWAAIERIASALTGK